MKIRSPLKIWSTWSTSGESEPRTHPIYVDSTWMVLIFLPRPFICWKNGDDNDDEDGDDDDEEEDGVHPNSHKHFIPYMGFCASIWDSVRHHCHHHHNHHDHQK